jgi:hypothetical protein
MNDKKSTTEKHAAALQTIWMAMRIRRYGDKDITQYIAGLVHPRCHWTPPSGKYLPRIAPADTSKLEFKSTQHVEATSCVEWSNVLNSRPQQSILENYLSPYC